MRIKYCEEAWLIMYFIKYIMSEPWSMLRRFVYSRTHYKTWQSVMEFKQHICGSWCTGLPLSRFLNCQCVASLSPFGMVRKAYEKLLQHGQHMRWMITWLPVQSLVNGNWAYIRCNTALNRHAVTFKHTRFAWTDCQQCTVLRSSKQLHFYLVLHMLHMYIWQARARPCKHFTWSHSPVEKIVTAQFLQLEGKLPVWWALEVGRPRGGPKI